jgi:hypothetical protein
MTFWKSVPLLASEERMNTWSRRLTSKEPRFRHWVSVYHSDGSQYLFNGAFIVDDPEDEEYVWVFTEHHGYFALSVTELEGLTELQRVDRQVLQAPSVPEPDLLFDDEDTMEFMPILLSKEPLGCSNPLITPLTEAEKQSIIDQINEVHREGSCG